MHQVFAPGRDYGTVLKRKETAGLLVSEVVYRPDVTISRHAHTSAHFCLVLDGAYVDIVDNRARLCRPATVLFHPAGRPHSNVLLNSVVRDLTIEIRQEWFRHFDLEASGLADPGEMPAPFGVETANRILRELARPDEVSGLALEALMLELFVKTSRRRSALDRLPCWLKQAKDLLTQAFGSSVTIRHIAERVGVHPVHLAAEFKRHYGCTVGAFVRHLRVMSACYQLTRSPKPLKEIAVTAGFFDQSHFTRTFKAMMGVTPAQFRRCAAPLH
jgi:AraC family transcriptional regulator